MAVTYLTNTSEGAPALTAAAGSLIGVMDFCLVTIMGWSKVFAGTNIASYRAPTGNRFYLGVDDTATHNARVRGFVTMTAAGVDVASGTEPFPTSAQQANGMYVYKSNSADATARPWWFASNGVICYLSITPGPYPALFGFGDFISDAPADAYNTCLLAERATGTIGDGLSLASSVTGSTSYGFVARSYTQSGGSENLGKLTDSRYSSQSVPGNDGSAYPNPVIGGLLMSPIQCFEPNTYLIRGTLPGIWSPLHKRPLSDNDTFSGSGVMSGKSFVARNVSAYGQLIVETSDTW